MSCNRPARKQIPLKSSVADSDLHDYWRVEIVGRDHPALPAFLAALPKDSGWPPGTVLSLTDREPTEFERAERYVAAFADEKMVGALSLHPAAAGNYHRMHNLHFHIDILPGWQGQGVGTALMQRMIRVAREEGYWRIYLGTLSWSERALGLFGHFGFRVEGISRAAYRVKSRAGDDYFLDGIQGSASNLMDAGRISKSIIKEGQHGFMNSLRHTSSGIVVEINPVFHIRTSGFI